MPHGEFGGDIRAQRSRSFGGVAATYERARPGYPVEAVRDLLGPEPLDVLDLGAGTGKLSRSFLAAGHRVSAVDPDPGMLAELARQLPAVSSQVGTAEALPQPDSSVNAVVAGQAYHWFDPDTALPEIARVLRTGGVIGLFWNVRDESTPWVARFGELVGSEDAGDSLTPPDLGSLFTFAEVRLYSHSHDLTVDGLVDLAASRSSLITMTDDARATRLAEVRALADEAAEDGLVRMPYRLQVWSGRTNG